MPVRTDEIKVRGNKLEKHLSGRTFLGEDFQGPVKKGLAVAVENRQIDILLDLEVLIEHGFVDARRRGNGLRARSVEPRAGKEVLRGTEDSGAGVRRSLVPRSKGVSLMVSRPSHLTNQIVK
jgi:hypothetical protein